MGNGNKVEFLVAVCALVSSIIAIWVAWDQSRVMRAQQDGMVYPVLQVDGFVSRRDESVAIGIRLENSGVGPALIESLSASANGQPITSLEPYRGTLPEGYQISWTGIVGGAVAPGKQVDPLRLDWRPDEITDAELTAVTLAWSEVDLEVCYCSVFQKCWLTSMNQSRALPTKSCPEGTTDIFEQFGAAGITPATAIPDEASQ